jgi:Phage major capsid protein E
MEDAVQMIDRRLEWMASSILQTGTVTISGEGYPTQFVNFQRDPSLTVTLAAGAKWTPTNVGTPSAPEARPSQNIDQWAAQVLQMSGAVATDVVFTLAAWNAFLLDYRVVGTIQFPPGEGGAVDITGGIHDRCAVQGGVGLLSTVAL